MKDYLITVSELPILLISYIFLLGTDNLIPLNLYFIYNEDDKVFDIFQKVGLVPSYAVDKMYFLFNFIFCSILDVISFIFKKVAFMLILTEMESWIMFR